MVVHSSNIEIYLLSNLPVVANHMIAKGIASRPYDGSRTSRSAKVNGYRINTKSNNPIANPNGLILPAVPASPILRHTLKKMTTGMKKRTIIGTIRYTYTVTRTSSGSGYVMIAKMNPGIATNKGIDAEVRYPAASIAKTAKITKAKDDAIKSK